MQSLRQLAKFLVPYRLWAILAPLFMIGEVALDLMQPRLVQKIVDEGIARSDFGYVVRTGVLMVTTKVTPPLRGSDAARKPEFPRHPGS